MDAEQLRLLMQDPKFMIALGMMQGNPKRGIGGVLGSGVQQAVTGQRLNDEELRRKQQLDRQAAADARQAAEDARAGATRQAMTGVFNTMNAPNLRPPFEMPTAGFSPEQYRTGMDLKDLADAGDPEGAASILQNSLAGKIQMPGIQAQPSYGTVPWHMQGIAPGTPEWEQRAAIAGRTEATPYQEGSMDLREQAAARAERYADLAERRFNRAADDGGGGSSTDLGLSKEQQRRRAEVTRARASVNSLFKSGVDARAFGEKNPGFQRTLELANQRMPGDDPAWESTTRARASKFSQEAKGRYTAALQRAKASGDKATVDRIRREAARAGVILPP